MSGQGGNATSTPAQSDAPHVVNATPPPGPETPRESTRSQDKIVSFQGQVDSATTAATPPDCKLRGFPRPDKFSIFAAGAYSGRDLGWQIDQSGHEATQIDVAVNHTGDPVVPTPGAYEPRRSGT